MPKNHLHHWIWIKFRTLCLYLLVLLSSNDLIFHHLPYIHHFWRSHFYPFNYYSWRQTKRFEAQINAQEEMDHIKETPNIIWMELYLWVFAGGLSSSFPIHWFFFLIVTQEKDLQDCKLKKHLRCWRECTWRFTTFGQMLPFWDSLSVIVYIDDRCTSVYCTCVRALIFGLINDLVILFRSRQRRGVQSKFQTSKYLMLKRFDHHFGTHPLTHFYHIDSESDKYLYGCGPFFAVCHPIQLNKIQKLIFVCFVHTME